MGLLKRKKKKTEADMFIDCTPKPKSTFTYSEKYYATYPLDPALFGKVEYPHADLKISMVPGCDPMIDLGFLTKSLEYISRYSTLENDYLTGGQLDWISNRLWDFKKQVELHREQHADVMA